MELASDTIEINQGCLAISIRRHHLLTDALLSIGNNQQNLLNKLQVSFTGEAGVDVGGLSREF